MKLALPSEPNWIKGTIPLKAMIPPQVGILIKVFRSGGAL